MQPASKIGHPSKGKIWLTVERQGNPEGRSHRTDLERAEIIWQLSQRSKLTAGDVIMTGTPAGVSQLQPGDKIECGVDGVGTLKVSIGDPDQAAAFANRKGAGSVRGLFCVVIVQAANDGAAYAFTGRLAWLACGTPSSSDIWEYTHSQPLILENTIVARPGHGNSLPSG